MKRERIEEYLHTLQAMEVHIPATAHNDHRQRIREMQGYFKQLLRVQNIPQGEAQRPQGDRTGTKVKQY